MNTEKAAKELVEKLFMELEKGTDVPNRIKVAKQCAIICVDEILNAHIFRKHSGYKTFWMNVKAEIEKL